MKLADIQSLIEPLRKQYRQAYNTLLGDGTGIIADINRHIMDLRGKQLRPTLTLLSAAACGLSLNAAPSHPIFKVTAAIEMLHNCTLIHDDVVDESSVRHGVPTANKVWNNKIAVLAGDYYLAKVMQTLNAVDIKPVTNIINETVISMSCGELEQQETCRHYNTSKEKYISIIDKKTAVFMSACCEIGAILAGAGETVQQTARKYGRSLGLAFQIRDDLIDFLPTEYSGKPQGNDISEHKVTLPLINAMSMLDEDTKAEISTLLDKKALSDKEKETVSNLVIRNDIVLATRKEMEKHLLDAGNEAKKMPHNKYSEALLEISEMMKEI